MAQDENQDRDYPHQAMATNGEQTRSAPEETSLASNGDQRKVTSVAKVAANRENAKRSRGPTSLEGKARSSRNSYKHGFFARQPLPPGEAGAALWGAYHDLVAGIWEYYKPVGYLEGLLTEKIATESIRYSRLLTFESRLVDGVNFFHWIAIDRFLRYQGTINRQLFQAMRELERMQEKRKAGAMASDGLSGPGYPGTETPLLGEDYSHSPEEGERSMEGSESDANIVPPVPQWERIPLIVDPGKDQNSPPSPTGANYGTNPTPANPRQPETVGPPNPPPPGKLTLAERAVPIKDPPPLKDPADAASRGQKQSGNVEQQDSTQEIPHRSGFTAPEHEDLSEAQQDSLRRRENELPDDPEDSS